MTSAFTNKGWLFVCRACGKEQRHGTINLDVGNRHTPRCTGCGALCDFHEATERLLQRIRALDNRRH